MFGSLMWYRAEDRLQRHHTQCWNWFPADSPKSYSSRSGTKELSKGHTAGTGCPFCLLQLATKVWRSLWVTISVTPRFGQSPLYLGKSVLIQKTFQSLMTWKTWLLASLVTVKTGGVGEGDYFMNSMPKIKRNLKLHISIQFPTLIDLFRG